MSGPNWPSVAGASIATTFACVDQADHIDHEGLGTDRTERAGMDAGATLDTFFLIDHTYTILIVGNRIHWADLLTRALQMGNRIVWACLGTLSALAAFIWVDVRLGISHADRSKRTGVLAGFTHTFTAVIGDCVGRNRALLTGCIDNLYDVVCIAVRRTPSARRILWRTISLSYTQQRYCACGPGLILVRNIVSSVL